MAITSTTLASACGANDQFIKVTSATGTAIGQIWRVESEYMIQTALAATGTSTTIPVARRGYNASTVQAHAILAPVANFLPSDMPGAQPNQWVNPAVFESQISSIGANGAIAIPTANQTLFVDKATAAALTLAAPSAASDGVRLTIFSTTAAAHTVTYDAGFYADTTSSDVATFAAKAGASMTIMAYKGAWGVISLGNVTIA